MGELHAINRGSVASPVSLEEGDDEGVRAEFGLRLGEFLCDFNHGEMNDGYGIIGT
jgi:hypothetical protein